MRRIAALVAAAAFASLAVTSFARADARTDEGESDTWPQPAQHSEERSTSPPRAHLALHAMAVDILRWTNVERLAHGLPAFEWSPAAAKAALAHSDEMMRLGYFSHTSPNAHNRDPLRRAQNAGLRGDSLFVGENIASGDFDTRDARAIVRMWMESPGHRRNILHRDFRYLGVGVAGRGSKLWSTQVFSATR